MRFMSAWGVGKVGYYSVAAIKYRDSLDDDETKSFDNGLRYGLQSAGSKRLLTNEYRKIKK